MIIMNDFLKKENGTVIFLITLLVLCLNDWILIDTIVSRSKIDSIPIHVTIEHKSSPNNSTNFLVISSKFEPHIVDTNLTTMNVNQRKLTEVVDIGRGVPYIYSTNSVVSEDIPLPSSMDKIRNLAKELTDILDNVK